MIISFRHKGLEALFLNKKTKAGKISALYAPKIRVMLGFLNRMVSEEEILDQPWEAHRLVGKNPHGQDLKGHWALKVSGNWRITYRFTEDGNVELLDYIDYH